MHKTRFAYAVRAIVVSASLLGLAGNALAGFGDQLHKLIPSQFATLTDSDLAGVRYGASVSVRSGTAVVSVSGLRDLTVPVSGAFVFDAATGAEQASLFPSDPFSSNANYATKIGEDSYYLIDGSVHVFPIDNPEAAATNRWLRNFDGSLPYRTDVAREGLLVVYFNEVYLTDASAESFVDTFATRYISQPTLLGASGQIAVSVADADSEVLAGIVTPVPRGRSELTDATVQVFDKSTGQYLRSLSQPVEDATQAREGIYSAFGRAIDADGGLAVVGDYQFEPRNPGGEYAGIAYVFDIATGERLSRFRPVNDRRRDNFGFSVAIDEGVVIVGAPHYDVEASGKPDEYEAGAAYLFDATTGLQLALLVADDAAESSYFGQSVDISDGFAVVGAPGANSAYVYDVSNPQLPGDFNGDRLINNADLNLLLNHWGSGELPTEWDGRQLAGDAVANAELNGLLYAWGRGDGAAPVPEPAGIAWLAVFIAGAANWSRRSAR